MNAGYSIFLFLFTFGIVCGSINAIGLWQPQLPNTQFSLTENEVTQIHRGAVASPLNFFTAYDLIIKFLTIIGTGFLAVFSLSLVFYGMGFPIGLLGGMLLQMIQSPATVVMLFFFYEQWTGRQVE